MKGILNKDLYKAQLIPDIASRDNNSREQNDTLSYLSNQSKSNVSIVTTDDEFYALQDRWCHLNNSSSKGNIFTSWEWLHLWWDVYKNDGNRQLYILKYTDDKGELTGLAPFQIINHPKKYFPCSKQLIMLGTGETDGSTIFGEYMDLLILPGFESVVIDSFSHFLSQSNSLWDGMKFHEILAGSHLQNLFVENNPSKYIQKIEAYGFRTIISLPETYQEYLMSLKKKMRNNITRTFSRLQSEQEYTINEIINADECADAIATLADLNRTRRGDLEKNSAFDYATFEKFHSELSKRLLIKSNSSQSVALRILNFKNEPVAALYSFIDGDTIHAYQSGFEKEAGHRYSLLTTMLTQEISNSINNKTLKYFNFMFSDDESTYKRRYSSETETMYKISYDKPNMKFKLYAIIHGPIKERVKKLLNKA